MTTIEQRDNYPKSAAEFTENVEKREKIGKVFEILFFIRFASGFICPRTATF
jgi:phosphate transport system permease protein